MATKLFKGGFAYAEFSSVSTFATATEIRQLLKAGTGVTPGSSSEEMSDGKVASAGKSAKIGIRSADVDNTAGSAYALLKTAEEANTPQYFRLVGIQNEQLVEDCEDAWNEQVIANVTSTLDQTAGNFKVGAGSAKLDVAVAAVAGVIGSEAIPALNLTTRKGVSLWIKSSVALSAGDLQLLLDDTALCASPIELINIPAVLQNAWTKVYLPFATPASLTAIISVGIKMIVDKGAFVLNIDDVRAIGDNLVVGPLIPTVEFETNEAGKFNAMRVGGQAFGGAESDIMTLNV